MTGKADELGEPTGHSGQPVENPHADSVRRLAAAMLWLGVRLGLVAAVTALAVAGGLAGWAGLAGAAVGAGLGFASSLVTLGMMRVAAALPVESLLGVALGGYILKMALLLAIMLPLRGVEALHPVALGLTVLAVVVAWAAADVIAFRRTKIPTIIPA